MRVLLTGGSGKLGRQIHAAFTKIGARVVITKSSETNIRHIDQIEDAVKKAAKTLGGIDILINNAGMFYKTPILEVTKEKWDEPIDINLRAPFFFAKEACFFLKKARPGHIINIADTYGVSPSAGYVPYGVSKAGLIAMTKGLAKELAPDVLVNCVCPGVIASKTKQSSELDCASDSSCSGNAINATLLKRPASINDVVAAVLFLATNNSITGQAIFVDCGRWV